MDYLEPGTEVWIYDQAIVLDGVIDCRHDGFQGEAYYVCAKQGGSMMRKLVFRDSLYVKISDREKLIEALNANISYLEIKIEKVMAE